MSKTIKTGICSYGMSGKLFHAPFIEAHPGFELTAIVERSKNDSRARYPNSKLYRSVDELINDPSIELVIVNTPVQTHYDIAKQAMNAGKHIIVEKPFTVTSKEAEELVKIAKEKKVSLFVYQNRRYDGDYHAVKNVIEQKLLGDLQEFEIHYDRFRNIPSGKAHKEGGLPASGTLYDLGAHMIDQSLQLFGWPKAIFADTDIMREGFGATDYYELLLFYPNKLRVRIKSSMLSREHVPAYILQGSKGSFFQQRSDQQEEQLLAGRAPSLQPWAPPTALPDGILHTEINNEVVRKLLTSTPGNYMGYFDDVYKSLTQNAPNPVPGEDGAKVIKVIEAAEQSAKEKKVINL
ncbi:MAG: Gfo/Idh/MocA family oxidoreductase [Bacteroidetes bacterium]|nr:Gfo/Idh/MocA family oxidoreductase [Bacteroidota bacterium]